MKQKLLIVLIAIMLSMLCACSTSKSTTGSGEKSMFAVLEASTFGDWQVVYHRQTRVMYVVSNGTYSHGNFTLLVNPDGTPMLYSGDE